MRKFKLKSFAIVLSLAAATCTFAAINNTYAMDNATESSSESESNPNSESSSESESNPNSESSSEVESSSEANSKSESNIITAVATGKTYEETINKNIETSEIEEKPEQNIITSNTDEKADKSELEKQLYESKPESEIVTAVNTEKANEETDNKNEQTLKAEEKKEKTEPRIIKFRTKFDDGCYLCFEAESLGFAANRNNTKYEYTCTLVDHNGNPLGTYTDKDEAIKAHELQHMQQKEEPKQDIIKLGHNLYFVEKENNGKMTYVLYDRNINVSVEFSNKKEAEQKCKKIIEMYEIEEKAKELRELTKQILLKESQENENSKKAIEYLETLKKPESNTTTSEASEKADKSNSNSESNSEFKSESDSNSESSSEFKLESESSSEFKLESESNSESSSEFKSNSNSELKSESESKSEIEEKKDELKLKLKRLDDHGFYLNDKGGTYTLFDCSLTCLGKYPNKEEAMRAHEYYKNKYIEEKEARKKSKEIKKPFSNKSVLEFESYPLGLDNPFEPNDDCSLTLVKNNNTREKMFTLTRSGIVEDYPNKEEAMRAHKDLAIKKRYEKSKVELNSGDALDYPNGEAELDSPAPPTPYTVCPPNADYIKKTDHRKLKPKIGSCLLHFGYHCEYEEYADKKSEYTLFNPQGKILGTYSTKKEMEQEYKRQIEKLKPKCGSCLLNFGYIYKYKEYADKKKSKYTLFNPQGKILGTYSTKEKMKQEYKRQIEKLKRILRSGDCPYPYSSRIENGKKIYTLFDNDENELGEYSDIGELLQKRNRLTEIEETEKKENITTSDAGEEADKSNSNSESNSEFKLESESNSKSNSEFKLESESNSESNSEFRSESESNSKSSSEFRSESESNSKSSSEFRSESESNSESNSEFRSESESNSKSNSEFKLESESNSESNSESRSESESNSKSALEPKSKIRSFSLAYGCSFTCTEYANKTVIYTLFNSNKKKLGEYSSIEEVRNAYEDYCKKLENNLKVQKESEKSKLVHMLCSDNFPYGGRVENGKPIYILFDNDGNELGKYSKLKKLLQERNRLIKIEETEKKKRKTSQRLTLVKKQINQTQTQNQTQNLN